jgi:hypothetical protein
LSRTSRRRRKRRRSNELPARTKPSRNFCASRTSPRTSSTLSSTLLPWSGRTRRQRRDCFRPGVFQKSNSLLTIFYLAVAAGFSFSNVRFFCPATGVRFIFLRKRMVITLIVIKHFIFQKMKGCSTQKFRGKISKYSYILCQSYDIN